MTARQATLLLALALGLAAIPRLWGIRDRGPFVLDEGVFVQEAQWIVSGVRAVQGSLALRAEERRTGQDVWKLEEQIQAIGEKTRGFPPYYGRPTHALLVALATWIVGYEPWAGALTSAVFSLGCIALAFLLARRLYGTGAALVAATLLAVSGYHILYSRQALAEMTSVFFLLASVLAYLKSLDREPALSLPWTIAAGLLWGFAITAHDRWLTMLPLLWVLELRLWAARGRAHWRAYAWRALLFHFFLLVPHGLYELPYHAILVFARLFGLHVPFQTHWEQVLGNLLRAAKGGGGFDPMNLLAYPYLFFRFDGPVLPLLYLAGLLYALRRRRWEDLWLAFWVVYPLAYASLTAARARYASASLVPAAILGGLFLAEVLRPRLAGAGRPDRRLAWAVAAAAAVSLGWAVRVQGESRLGYAEAFAFLAARGDGRHVSTAAILSNAYMGRVAADPPEDEAALRDRYREGYRYLVVEPFRYYMRDFVASAGSVLPDAERYRRMGRVVEKVEAELRPVYRADCPAGGFIQGIFEVQWRLRDALRFQRDSAADASVIAIYDLAELYEREPA